MNYALRLHQSESAARLDCALVIALRLLLPSGLGQHRVHRSATASRQLHVSARLPLNYGGLAFQSFLRGGHCPVAFGSFVGGIDGHQHQAIHIGSEFCHVSGGLLMDCGPFLMEAWFDLVTPLDDVFSEGEAAKIVETEACSVGFDGAVHGAGLGFGCLLRLRRSVAVMKGFVGRGSSPSL